MLLLTRRPHSLSILAWMSSACCIGRLPANTTAFVLNIRIQELQTGMVNIARKSTGLNHQYTSKCTGAVSTRPRLPRPGHRPMGQTWALWSSSPAARDSAGEAPVQPSPAPKPSPMGTESGVPAEICTKPSSTVRGTGFGAPQAPAPPRVRKAQPAKRPQPQAPPRGNNLLIIGLGNPGDKFKMTRHNAGFMVAEELARRYGATLKIKTAFMGEYCSITIKGKSVGILRPITFMNLSGQSARKVVEYFKLPINAALVVVDEVALDFGQVKLKTKGSAGGHNGLKSIQSQLKTQEYCRMRVGVGAAGGSEVLSDHVLGEFSRSEKKELASVIAEACDAVEHWIEEDNVDKVMTRLHSR